MSARMRGAVLLLLALLFWVLALGASISTAGAPVELRWDGGQIDSDAFDKRRGAQEKPLRAAAWEVLPGQTVEGNATATARVARGTGELSLLTGGPLHGHVRLEAGGCAVSLDMARALWGADAVLGRELRIDGKTYPVLGVYARGQADVLIGWDGRQDVKFDRMALSFSGVDAGRQQACALDFAQRCGMGAPDQVLDAPLVGALSAFAARLPGWALAAWAVARLLRAARASARWPWKLACVGAAALLLWGMAAQIELPRWILPTRWSDFAFWQQTLDGLWDRVAGTLAARHGVLDRERMAGAGGAILFGCVSARMLAEGFTACMGRGKEGR